MRYAVLTAKHHEGFCLWDTDCTDYKVTNTPAGRDVLREFVDAFRAEGIRVGFYYSLVDWHHPDFTIDGRHPQRPREMESLSHEEKAAYFDRVNVGKDMAKYRKYMKEQVTELLTRYGQIDLLWYDFTYADDEFGKS